MTEYVTLVTDRLDDDTALMAALDAHERLLPRDQAIPQWQPERWAVEVVPSPAYLAQAPQPWWRWARAWRP